ncbi:conserved hypothetical protein [Burkholderia diffusa]|nr:conserved hypothetical protein [Burkholderia diffusa]
MSEEIVITAADRFTLRNAAGTAERDCACKGWLNHWKNYSEKSAPYCSVDGCTEMATDGAHVTLPNHADPATKSRHWIAPMCHDHNMKHGATFRSIFKVTVVSANTAETCR